ncbi:hypothetical protein ACSS6W_008839 [Trichoderma asperelloides]
MTQVQAHNPHDVAIWEEFKQTFAGFREAFSAPFRARTIFGCFIMGMQQLAGIDGVFYYAPILFEKAGLSGEQASFLASGVSALAILGITIPATFLADKWGRRTSSLLGGVLITTLMLLMGSLYAADKVHADRGAGKWVVIVSIYLFAIVFNGTWAIGFRIFLIESLPRKTRSSASSLAQSANWAGYINYRMRVTLQDSRQLVGQMLAYDRHMNLVLADTEEFRRIKRKQNKPAAPGGSSAGQTVVQEEKRTLGLVIVRGAHIISLTVESPPPADPSARLGKATTGGIASTLQAGPGVARPAGRGAAAPISLAGPAAGVGGAAPPPGFPSFPGAPGAPGAPGFPGRGARKLYYSLLFHLGLHWY